MLNSYTIAVGMAMCSLAATGIAWAAHRENLRRRDERFCRMVRTAIFSIEGVDVRDEQTSLAWQACETSGRRG
jgi:hypothetical protein